MKAIHHVREAAERLTRAESALEVAQGLRAKVNSNPVLFALNAEEVEVDQDCRDEIVRSLEAFANRLLEGVVDQVEEAKKPDSPF